MKFKKVAAVAVGVGLASFTALVVGAPYLTWIQMRNAAERHDAAALSEHIDFAHVRESLKKQLGTVLAPNATAGDPNAPLARLGAAAAGLMANQAVDAYITPDGLKQVMEDVLPKLRGGSTPLDIQAGYESIDRFAATVTHPDYGPVKLVLKRHGLGWKLAEVEVPHNCQLVPGEGALPKLHCS